MKKSLGVSRSMCEWSAVTTMPWARSSLMTGLTSSAMSTKSPVVATRGSDGLEIHRVGHAHARRNFHAAVLDGLGAGDADLEDAARHRALVAERVLELVEGLLPGRR